MIATWMVYASLVGLLASLAAQALDRAARANRLPSRIIWLAAMIATVLAPVVGYAVRRASPNATTARVTVGGATSLGPMNEARSTRSSLSTAVAALRVAAVKVDRPVVFIWAAFSLVLFGRLAFATGMVWRDRRTWTPREIDGVPLFVTPDLGPAVVALPRSEILVPEWLLSLDETHVAMVVRHEREHRAAGDPRLLVAATVFTALVPWNPALWWQKRRLRLAVEVDCDARVLRADPRVDQYGSLLLAIAQHPRTALYAAATLTESTSDLERRIDAMTETPPAAPRVTAAALGAFAVAAVFAACAMPSPDVIAGPSAAQATKVAAKAPFEFQVERPATPAPDNAQPRYPDQLRKAGIGGVVIAKFVVDTNGRAEMKTLLIVKTDHDLFTNSVRQALPEMRFVPAILGGRRVKQLVQMPFIFALSSEELAAGKAMAHKVAFDPAPMRKVMDRAPVLVVDGVAADGSELRSRPAHVMGDTVSAALTANNSPPAYPVQLRKANIEGQVVARFVVRDDGSVDQETFRVVNADHDLFVNSVRDRVKTFRFSPATIKGKPVSQLVTMPFVFSLSK